MAEEIPVQRHVLENILGYRPIQRLLGWMTDPGAGNRSWLERVCECYDNPARRGPRFWHWRLPEAAINLALKRAHLDRELMKRKLFHHRPTVKSLALTGRSIARFGLSGYGQPQQAK